MTTSFVTIKSEDENKEPVLNSGEAKLEKGRLKDKQRWKQFSLTSEVINHKNMKNWLNSL